LPADHPLPKGERAGESESSQSQAAPHDGRPTQRGRPRSAPGHGRVVARRVVEESLTRIAARNTELNAFSVVVDNEARDQARFLELGQGDERGPLYGVPVAIKEELDVAGGSSVVPGRPTVSARG
jgi:hypothetical protein